MRPVASARSGITRMACPITCAASSPVHRRAASGLRRRWSSARSHATPKRWTGPSSGFPKVTEARGSERRQVGKAEVRRWKYEGRISAWISDVCSSDLLRRAKAVLCAGLKVSLFDEASGEREGWYYEDGLPDYRRSQLTGASPGRELLPAEVFIGAIARDTEAVDWALCWLPEADGGEMVQEAYVNLIPKIGRAHV